MRQVRRKTADPAARPYLLKAKNEGLKLSWNQFESMLPQDGFGRLGLACFECLLGPCRINPFSRTEERTVCGLNRDELVYKGMANFLKKKGELYSNTISSNEDDAAQKEAAAVIENEAVNFKYVNGLVKIAQSQVTKMKALKQADTEATKQIGLGTLKEDYVNIILEGVSPLVLSVVETLAEDLKEEALSRGAKGFNILLVGDLNPYHPFDTVTNQGGSEFAILTGLVDLYAVGKGGLGLGRNVVSSYPTVYSEIYNGISKDELKDSFVQAAVAYTKRDNSKVLPSDQLQTAQAGVKLDITSLKAHLEQGTFKGVCVLGGGSSIKVTEDEFLYNSAVQMAEKGILCLTYGNAAVTLGKYGLLEQSTVESAKALGREQGSAVYCLGSELDGTRVFDLLQVIDPAKVVALFPELSSSRDLQYAVSFAGAGVNVLTSIKLPVDGSGEIASELGQLIEYAEPKELAAEALAKLGF